MEFKSPNSNEKCTAAQLIAEIMVTRQAQKKGINLPYKFWNLDEWKKKYKTQILAANALLKLYSPLAILNALKRKDCQWQFSLRANGIPEAIDEEQRKINSEEKLIEKSSKIEINKTDEFRQVGTGKKSVKSKLD